MKKQLFSFLMVLALVVLAGTSAMAQQGDGLAPSTAYWAIEGSVTTHTITPDGSSTTWNILIVDNTDASIGQAGTAATVDSDYKIYTAGSASSISVRWLKSAGANKLYAVEAVETADAGGCTTRRRSYVGVFGFDVDVLLTNSTTGADADADADFTDSNSWCGDVVTSSLTGAQIAAADASLINNPTNGEVKTTDTHYRVVITLTNAPTGFSLNSLKWRLKYSLQNTQSVNVYGITSLDGANFGGETANATIGNSGNTGTIDFTSAANNMIYFPRRADGTGVSTYDYDFTITHHNMLGAASTTFQIRIDEVNVEYGAGTQYDNGTKMNTATVATTGLPTLADGITGTQTINHGPATTTILITD
jgi:hypothetical protein